MRIGLLMERLHRVPPALRSYTHNNQSGSQISLSDSPVAMQSLVGRRCGGYLERVCVCCQRLRVHQDTGMASCFAQKLGGKLSLVHNLHTFRLSDVARGRWERWLHSKRQKNCTPQCRRAIYKTEETEHSALLVYEDI